MMKMFRLILIFILFASSGFCVDYTIINDFVNYIDNDTGYVVSVEDDGTILTDMGTNKNAFEGMRFNIYKHGKQVVHPITGEVIAETKVNIGEIVLETVFDKYSVARVINKSDEILPGYYLKLKTPIELNIQFFDMDPSTQKEIENEINRKNLFKIDKNSPFTLNIFSDGIYGLTLEFLYFDKMISKFYSSNLRIEIAKENLKLANHDIEGKGYIHMAVCQVDGSGRNYLVLADDKYVDIYKLNNLKPVYFKSIKEKFNDIVSLDCDDLNLNKKDEIFISVSDKGRGVKSYVYEYDDNNNFKELKGNFPFLVRSVHINGKKQLVIQRLTKDGKFIGDISFLEYNGDYVKGDDIKNTSGFSIFGFGIGDLNGDSLAELIRINDKSLIEIYSPDGDKLYVSREEFGDTKSYFTMRKKYVDKFANKEEIPDKFREISSRIYIRDRVFITKSGTIITGKNVKIDNLLPTFEKYVNKMISANIFENNMLRTVWTSENLGSNVFDFYAIEEGDTVQLFILSSQTGGFLKSSNSKVIYLEYSDENRQ